MPSVHSYNRLADERNCIIVAARAVLDDPTEENFTLLREVLEYYDHDDKLRQSFLTTLVYGDMEDIPYHALPGVTRYAKKRGIVSDLTNPNRA